jgi:hypothetical protein
MRTTSLVLLGAAAPLALGAYVVSLPATPAAPAIPSVNVIATDYALQAPDTLPAGSVTLRLVNRGADVPVGDVTMTLHDYSFTLSDPLRAGTRIIEVRNEAAQDHEIELIRLAPGRTAQDVLAWLKDEKGPLPGVPLGGVAPLDPRGVSWFQADLEPGRYMLICFVPDERSGRAHFTHGMLREVDVGSAVSSRE